MFRDVTPLLAPKSIAIVGASETGGGGWPRAIYDNFEYAGFPADLYLINPKREALWGHKVYPGFADLPGPVDLALTIIPAEAIPETLADGVAHGLKSALVYAARFGEGGDADGARRADAVKALCDQGLRVCGPNCMGALSLPHNLLLYPATRIRGLPRGEVGVVFQSGGTFMFWLQQAAVRGLGFSYAVSSGNELDLDIADYINFMVEDKDTGIIACMVEGIRRPDAFMVAAEKALSARKPVVMVKIGRSEAGGEAAKSHTGALAGDDQVFDAVCAKYGVVRCHSLDDMIDCCLAFTQHRYPKGRRIGMAGFSGGGKGLFLDYAAENNAVMAEFSAPTRDAIKPIIDYGLPTQNPIDCGAGIASRPHDFSKLCQIIAADDNVDIVAVQGQPPAQADDPVDATVFSNILNSTDKPVMAYVRLAQNIGEAGREFQKACGMPFLLGLPQTVRALQGLIVYGARLAQGVASMPDATGKADNLEGAALNELLGKHGLTPPRSAFAATPEDAAAAAAEIGFPVALKLVSEKFTHKTEIGGVSLDLAEPAAVAEAGLAMAKRLFAVDASAPIDGYLVQEMVAGVEMLIGVREDPQFGPFMVAGLGGVLVEAMRDVAFRMLPVSEAEAHAMLDELRGKAVLGAFRGRSARDKDALARAIAGLSDIFLDHRPFLADLEVNPLIVLEQGAGVRAVDVRPVRRTE